MNESAFAMILNHHNENRVNCRGLNDECKVLAKTIANSAFQNENISFENWNVCEIPLCENNCMVICLYNEFTKQAVDLVFDENENVIQIETTNQNDEWFGDPIIHATITKALEHESAIWNY